MSKSLLTTTGTVGGITLISRVLGFLRDMIVARVLGAGLGADAFLVAFRIPNFMRRLFTEGAFSQVLVPVLTEYKTQHTHREVQEISNKLAGTLAVMLMLVTVIGVIAAPLLVFAFAPGFTAETEKFALTVDLLRITFPYVLLITLTAYVSSLLNTYGNFAVPAFTPVFLNLCLIASALWLAPAYAQPAEALAWAVFSAGIVQLMFQLPFLQRLRLLPKPRWSWNDPALRRVMRAMVPAIFGSSVTQVNILVNTLLASFLVTGSVSWLYYSDRLVEFPVGIFGVTLATIVLPKLAQKYVQGSLQEFAAIIDMALRWAALLTIPAMLGLMILAGPIMATLFFYGEFRRVDVEMSALSLMAFSAGLPALVLVKILIPGFYARHDTATPVKVGVIAITVNLLLGGLLIMIASFLPNVAPHAALALAVSIAAYINGVLLYRFLRAAGVYQPRPGWGKLLGQIALATLAMTAVIQVLAADLPQWLNKSGSDRAINLLWLVGVGAATYTAGLLALGVRPGQLRLSGATSPE